MPKEVGEYGKITSRIRKKVWQLSPQEEVDCLKALSECLSRRENVDDPVIKAKQIMVSCCEGTTIKGKPWRNCPPGLNERFRQHGFDFDTLSEIPNWYEAKLSKVKPKDPAGQIPRELDVPKRGNPILTSSILSFDEDKNVKSIVRRYKKDYPDLVLETDEEVLELLAKQLVAYKRYTNQALAGGKLPTTGNYSTDMINSLEKLQKMLGIDRASRDKIKAHTEEGSVADLVKEFEDYVSSGECFENEMNWAVKEWAILLRKIDREDEQGNKELNEVIFERLSGGIPVSVARKFIKNPYPSDYDDFVRQVKADVAAQAKVAQEDAEVFADKYKKSRKKTRKFMKQRLIASGLSKDKIKALCPRKRKKVAGE